jgi:hypothetical protein
MKPARILVSILALNPFHDKYEREIRKAGRQRWREWKREQHARNGQKSGLALAVQALIWLLGLILFALLTSAINDLIR